MDLGSLHVFGELCVCLGGLHVVGGRVFGGVCIYWGFVYIRGIGRCWGTLCVSEGSACIVDCMCFGDLCMWVSGVMHVFGGVSLRGESPNPLICT